MADDADLLALDQAVVDSILGGAPLPGSGTVVHLPDLDFLRRDDAILVSSRGLPGSLSGAALGTELTTIDVEGPGGETEDLAYLEVSNASERDDVVRVTVRGRLRRAGSDAELGLSAVQVTFRRRDGRWVADPDTVTSAS
ncbi:hypothetical protein [Microbacterium sp. SLBN-146]|uniref:hypothetical protein n=1 Tax=Microbacterium sp. SLBN-146 TaxID=2768457 RepID=UPI00115423EA|nr:hypothetical protein [Microbacterium sp. SLBN-146]TQJ31152.1 hypothetical protein FBY39_1614 [Microbacterium sp. SLBN-146]